MSRHSRAVAATVGSVLSAHPGHVTLNVDASIQNASSWNAATRSRTALHARQLMNMPQLNRPSSQNEKYVGHLKVVAVILKTQGYVGNHFRVLWSLEVQECVLRRVLRFRMLVPWKAGRNACGRPADPLQSAMPRPAPSQSRT